MEQDGQIEHSARPARRWRTGDDPGLRSRSRPRSARPAAGERKQEQTIDHGFERLHDEKCRQRKHQTIDHDPNAPPGHRFEPDPAVTPSDQQDREERSPPELDPHVCDDTGRGALRSAPAHGLSERLGTDAQVRRDARRSHDRRSVVVLRGPEESRNRPHEQHGRVAAPPPIIADGIGVEDRAGAVDELVAGFRLEGEGGRVLSKSKSEPR